MTKYDYDTYVDALKTVAEADAKERRQRERRLAGRLRWLWRIYYRYEVVA